MGGEGRGGEGRRFTHLVPDSLETDRSVCITYPCQERKVIFNGGRT